MEGTPNWRELKCMTEEVEGTTLPGNVRNGRERKGGKEGEGVWERGELVKWNFGR